MTSEAIPFGPDPSSGKEQSRVNRLLFSRMDKQDEKIDEIGTDVKKLIAGFEEHKSVTSAISGQVETLTKLVGEEKEDGAGNILSTGMIGRMRRNEGAVDKMTRTYRAWISFGSGFVMAGGALLIALWWLVGDRLAVLLRGVGH